MKQRTGSPQSPGRQYPRKFTVRKDGIKRCILTAECHCTPEELALLDRVAVARSQSLKQLLSGALDEGLSIAIEQYGESNAD